MSDLKAFAKFPALGGEGAYQLIDIYQIEAIGQSTAPTAAVVFAIGTERFYQIEVPQEELDRAGEPDAASWCLSLVTKVARISLEVPTEAEGDDEDDFTPPRRGPNWLDDNRCG